MHLKYFAKALGDNGYTVRKMMALGHRRKPGQKVSAQNCQQKAAIEARRMEGLCKLVREVRHGPSTAPLAMSAV